MAHALQAGRWPQRTCEWPHGRDTTRSTAHAHDRVVFQHGGKRVDIARFPRLHIASEQRPLLVIRGRVRTSAPCGQLIVKRCPRALKRAVHGWDGRFQQTRAFGRREPEDVAQQQRGPLARGANDEWQI